FGLALFTVDRLINGAPTDLLSATHEIRISTSQQAALREAFQAEHGRQPNAAELRDRLAFWIEEQVLYREALALNLDRADVVVRRQLAQKMRFLLEQSPALTPPSDADLQSWLTQHASAYGTAPSLDFEHIFLSRGRHGDTLHAAAERIRQQLRHNPSTWQTLSDPFSSGLVLLQASPASVRAAFGPDFADRIQGLPLQQPPVRQWSGPIASSFGLHFVRLTTRSPFQPAQLATVRARVLADYEIAARKRLSDDALLRLKARYRIRFDDAPS
ncbi:MAG: peptidylprolyl isomerase, partial [Paraperlucidibaca sp.]